MLYTYTDGILVSGEKFQTKLTYGMICYVLSVKGSSIPWVTFQTKLTYGMICYETIGPSKNKLPKFQTKLTYGMICYTNNQATSNKVFKVSN